jgi:hypothetical protein
MLNYTATCPYAMFPAIEDKWLKDPKAYGPIPHCMAGSGKEHDGDMSYKSLKAFIKQYAMTTPLKISKFEGAPEEDKDANGKRRASTDQEKQANQPLPQEQETMPEDFTDTIPREKKRDPKMLDPNDPKVFARWKQYKTCESCVTAGGGWCLHDKKCADDKPGPCRGPDDHVGKNGDNQDCEIARNAPKQTESGTHEGAPPDLDSGMGGGGAPPGEGGDEDDDEWDEDPSEDEL